MRLFCRKMKDLVFVASIVSLSIFIACSGSDRDLDDPAQITADSLRQSGIDNDSIEWYITEYGIENVITEDTGIRYALTKEGNGETPDYNDIVSVEYTGMFLNNKVFDTTIEDVAIDAGIDVAGRIYTPLRFNFTKDGSGISSSFLAQFRNGLNKILSMTDDNDVRIFSKGSKALLFMPSAVAYGVRGDQFYDQYEDNIPPNTVLIFEFKLVTFRP
ncbi:hypothetical protein [Reichenbachiella sp. MALMAid0571]|uniref:FKBP-type peptidyl-prolyl cis-trans isomerase n=1 Tax=Reichenbachiella sp. MALMAid0571 TaxID=3143939 RepID=UPI0032DEB132